MLRLRTRNGLENRYGRFLVHRGFESLPLRRGEEKCLLAGAFLVSETGIRRRDPPLETAGNRTNGRTTGAQWARTLSLSRLGRTRPGAHRRVCQPQPGTVDLIEIDTDRPKSSLHELVERQRHYGSAFMLVVMLDPVRHDVPVI